MAGVMYIAGDAISLKRIQYEDDGRDISKPSDLSAVDASKGIFACECESFIS